MRSGHFRYDAAVAATSGTARHVNGVNGRKKDVGGFHNMSNISKKHG